MFVDPAVLGVIAGLELMMMAPSANVRKKTRSIIVIIITSHLNITAVVKFIMGSPSPSEAPTRGRPINRSTELHPAIPFAWSLNLLRPNRLIIIWITQGQADRYRG